MPEVILRLPEVARRLGLCENSVYNRVAKGIFPRPISLGSRAVGWREADVDEWIRARQVSPGDQGGRRTTPRRKVAIDDEAR